MYVSNFGISLVFLTCAYVLANVTNIPHCANQHMVSFKLLSFDAEGQKCDDSSTLFKCDFWFYARIIGPQENGTAFFANGDNKNSFNHQDSNGKTHSFTWKYEEGKGNFTLAILLVEDDRHHLAIEMKENLRNLAETFAKYKTIPNKNICFWLKLYTYRLINTSNIMMSDSFTTDNSHCSTTAENVEIGFQFQLDITTKNCPDTSSSMLPTNPSVSSVLKTSTVVTNHITIYSHKTAIILSSDHESHLLILIMIAVFILLGMLTIVLLSYRLHKIAKKTKVLHRPQQSSELVSFQEKAQISNTASITNTSMPPRSSTVHSQSQQSTLLDVVPVKFDSVSA